MPTFALSRKRRVPALLTFALAVAVLVAPAPVAAGTPTPLGPTVQLFGRGYGHGVGMSQHGARGRALAGETATTILAHYFAGTTIEAMDPATTIRVILMTGFVPSAGTPLVIVGHGSTWTASGVPGELPAGATLSVRPPASGSLTWALQVTDPGGAVIRFGGFSGVLTVKPTSEAGRLELKSKPSSYDEYRGSLVLRASGTTSLAVVNHVALDAYLRGVVPVEMPASWPTEALKAQAIAARSYAAYRIRTTSTFDLYDDTRSQVYRGIRGEVAATNAVIGATSGLVMKSKGSNVNALFHSTGGCATEHNENAFVASSGTKVAGPVSYLRGSLDRRPDGTCWDSGAPYATWKTATYSLAALSAMFAGDTRTNVGTLVSLDLSNRGVSGRLVSVTLNGSAGTKTVSGDVFRIVFNARKPAADPILRSNLFDLAPLP